MRKEISSHLKSKSIKGKLTMFLIIIALFVFINGILIYTINPNNSYFIFIKKIIPFPAMIVDKNIISMAEFDKELLLMESLYKTAYKVDFINEEENLLNEIKGNICRDIKNRIIMEIILSSANISISNKEIDWSYEKLISNFGGEKEAKNILEFASGWKEKDLKKKIYYNLLKQRVKELFIYQVKIEIEYIFLDDTATSNKDISLVAEKNDQGFYYFNELPDDISDVISSIAVGEKSNIVELESNYYTVKLEDERGYYRGTLEEFLKEQEDKTRIWEFVPSFCD